MDRLDSFEDPLEDIDPIMEQAFSVHDDGGDGESAASSEAEDDDFLDSDFDDDYGDYEEDDYEDDGEQEAFDEVSQPVPTVSDVQFPTLDDTPGGTAIQKDVFSNIPVGVSVELGRSRISLKEVFDLSEGSIIELERMVGEPLDLVVNGQVVAQGEVVAIDNNYGLRVTGITADS